MVNNTYDEGCTGLMNVNEYYLRLNMIRVACDRTGGESLKKPGYSAKSAGKAGTRVIEILTRTNENLETDWKYRNTGAYTERAVHTRDIRSNYV